MDLLTGVIYVVIGIGLIAVSRSDPRWRTMFILLGVSMVMRASADVASALGWLSEPAWLLKGIEYASMAVTAAALILWWRKLLTTPRATTTALALLLLLAAPRAESQRRGAAPPGAAPVARALSVDLGAALDERWRVVLEPIVLGRVTVGVSGQWTTAPDREHGGVSVPFALAIPPEGEAPCTSEICTTGYPGYFPYHERVRYRAAAASLHLRWYPELLSVGRGDGSAQFYVGEFIGYHRRRITTSSWYGWGGAEPPTGGPGVPEPGRPDSAVAPPVPPPVLPPPTPSRWTQHLRGWEPGVELGVRGRLGRRVLLDLGASTRLLTLDDPMSSRRPGQTETRLVVGVGVGW